MPEIPSRHDPVTIPCPNCARPFTPTGKRRYCTDACKAAAYRRRHHVDDPPFVVPPARPRKPVTVYECDTCGSRASVNSAAPTVEPSCAASASAVSARTATNPSPSPTSSARRWGH